jgi:hypothetical protein
MNGFAELQDERGKHYPRWQEGEMEIHHIYTGRGEQSFLIFPDGTSMLIDSGDFDPPSPEVFNFKDMKMCDPLPDASRRAGEWIARYVLDVNPAGKHVDYLMVSHFHNDHVGDAQNRAVHTVGRSPDYVLSGIPETGEYLDFDIAVDRGWPDYNYPEPMGDMDNCVENYRAFLAWKIKTANLRAEAAGIGSKDQFVLRKDPRRYQGIFEIRTLAANGKIWTGTGADTVNYFDLNPKNIEKGNNENYKSIVLKISFGPFKYYTGGDFNEDLFDSRGNLVNIEEEVGKACGPVNVCKVNHHSFIDSMSEGFVRNVKARAYIIPVWDYLHIQPSTMTNMTNRSLYPESRGIFPTNIPNVVREEYKNEPWMGSVCPVQGHIVIKVTEDGRKYRIYILKAEDEGRRVKAVYEAP